MGEIAEGLINGDFDFFTGEYLGRGYGFPRGRGLWQKRKNSPNYKKNPRRGVMNYVHQKYVGKAQMPAALKIVKHYAKEFNIEWKSEEEVFIKISAIFDDFRKWMDENAGKMYQTY